MISTKIKGKVMTIQLGTILSLKSALRWSPLYICHKDVAFRISYVQLQPAFSELIYPSHISIYIFVRFYILHSIFLGPTNSFFSNGR